jgi:asparagine synthase (glutamine-hydrolysing)
MCGISGIFNYLNSNQIVDTYELLRIRDYMFNRGPDGVGLWVSDNNKVGFAHSRLSVIDLSSGGAQPMVDPVTGCVICFNGEIYNYRELRNILVSKGYQFLTGSDTEVLLKLYADKGAEMVNDLRGMYAFAIYDPGIFNNQTNTEYSKKNSCPSLFLVRDPYGIKPLYYADNGQTIRFASQVKALLAGGKIDTTQDPAGQVGFLLWGSIPEPFTLYKNIRSLPAGSCIRINIGSQSRSFAPHTFFNIADIWKLPKENLTHYEAKEKFANALRDTVNTHLISDVPVGIFLSAGLDSCTLSALVAETKTKLKTVTLGFSEFRGTIKDEVPLAEIVAKKYGADHKTVWISKDDFDQAQDQIFHAMDQPSIDGINSYFVSLAMKRAGIKVALSGIGGDEIFGSYPSFRQIPKLVNSLSWTQYTPILGKTVRRLSTKLAAKLLLPKFAGVLEYGGTFPSAYLLRRGLYMPWELSKILEKNIVNEGLENLQTIPTLKKLINGINPDLNKISVLESCWYMRNQLLRDIDWASMAHSIEVRTPLVDINFLKNVVPLLGNFNKNPKQIFSMTPNIELPIEVLEKAKTGFGIPVSRWLSSKSNKKNDLREWAEKVFYKFTDKTLIDDNSVKNILFLHTDSFGSHGGIAKFNRDFLTVVSNNSNFRALALPRKITGKFYKLPNNLDFNLSSSKGKFSFVKESLLATIKEGSIDIIICAHINLLPVARICQAISGAKLGLVIHGIDAWHAPKGLFYNRLNQHIDFFISVSEITRKRFCQWSGVETKKGFILANSIEKEKFGPGPKNHVLVTKYNLDNKKVMMTMGRIDSRERYKGFDELIELLPKLIELIPELNYLIVGDGDDLQRLKNKARTLNVSNHIIFTGYIEESLKADYFRLADVFVMPSSGEGFGIVFIEAMACGVPCIGSKLDGGREALLNGVLGRLVDPHDNIELLNTIVEVLYDSKKIVPEGMSQFYFESFSKNLNNIINNILK